MQFIYYPFPKDTIILTGDAHKYLFKVRRTQKNEEVKIRNLKDNYLYIYKIKEINKKEAHLFLKEKIYSPSLPSKYLHIGWCIIDPKNIEKTLPMLNEIGVSKISFFYCDFSQRNFKLKQDRLEKILINSSQQCGRSNIIEIEILNTLEEFINKYKNFIALDFDGEKIECKEYNSPIIIGPEGGFSQEEKKLFTKKLALNTFILRSETACVSVSSKILS